MCSKKNRNIFRRLIKNQTIQTTNPITLLLKGLFINKGSRYPFSFLLITFCLIALSSCDKEEMIINRWNLQQVFVNNEPIKEPYPLGLRPIDTHYTFYYANSLNIRTLAEGGWTESADGFYSFENKSTIKMRFTLLYQRYEFSAKIKKLTKRELHLEYTYKGDTYILKLYGN